MAEASQAKSAGVTGRVAARIGRWTLVAGLGLLALASYVQGSSNALATYERGGSTDLHSYWGPGRALLAGHDPYADALGDEAYRTADGEGLAYSPAYAPLMLLVLSPLSALSWQTARLLFLIANLATASLLPWVALRLSPTPIPRIAQWAVALAFYGMLPTRAAISTGQPVLLTLMAALLGVALAARRPWVGGALIAVALTKWSLFLPALLWLAIEGAWLPIAVAVLAQPLAAVVIAVLASVPLPRLLGGYSQLALVHLGLVGDLDVFSLEQRLGLAPSVPFLAATAVLLLTALLTMAAIRSGRAIDSTSPGGSAASLALLALLVLAALPIGYHRIYDGVVVILLLIALLAATFAWGSTLANRLSRRRQRLVWSMVGVSMALLLLPERAVSAIWPGWETAHAVGSLVSAMAAWCAAALIVWWQPRPELPAEVPAMLKP